MYFPAEIEFFRVGRLVSRRDDIRYLSVFNYYGKLLFHLHIKASVKNFSVYKSCFHFLYPLSESIIADFMQIFKSETETDKAKGGVLKFAAFCR